MFVGVCACARARPAAVCVWRVRVCMRACISMKHSRISMYVCMRVCSAIYACVSVRFVRRRISATWSHTHTHKVDVLTVSAVAVAMNVYVD